MMKRYPFADPSPDQEHPPDQFKPADPPIDRAKAAFQWPPECVWPFIDHGWDGNT